MLDLVPVSISDAREFVSQFHRHHQPPRGGKFAIAVSDGQEICGVAIVGRPASRKEQEKGWTAEVTRVATNGTKNASSMLYAACWRAARAMGYKRMITYNLPSESGASLRAAGARVIGETKGGTWNRLSRPRVDRHPLQNKIKWEWR